MSDKIKWVVYLWLIVGLSACRKECITDVINLQDDSKLWLVTESFDMQDVNGIGKTFYVHSSDSYYLEGSSGVLVFTTNITKRQYFYQHLNSTTSDDFSLSVSANYEPYGDELSVEINRISMIYDLKYKTITRMSYNEGINSRYLSMSMGEDKYYQEGKPILSTVEELDTHTINGVEYLNVLHFKLNDFRDIIIPNTVVEYYLCQQKGLLYYKLDNGMSYMRI